MEANGVTRRQFLKWIYSIGVGLAGCAPATEPLPKSLARSPPKHNAQSRSPPKYDAQSRSPPKYDAQSASQTTENREDPQREEILNKRPKFTIRDGTSALINNPEYIKPEYLGDNNLRDNNGNRIQNVAIFRDTLEGICHAWYSHVNITGKDIYYGIQLYNPGSKTLEVVLQNRGTSIGWGNLGKEWIDFFQKPLSESYKLPGGKSLWILTSGPINDTQPFTGAVDFKVDGQVQLNAYAFADIKNIDGTAKAVGKVNGIVTHSSIKGIHDEGRTYKGLANGTALEAYISLDVGKIFDPGKIVINEISSFKTHTCYPNRYNPNMPVEILELRGPNGEVYRCGSETNGNLANWGIPYYLTFEFINTSTKPRETKIYFFGPDVTNYSEAIVFVNRQEGYNIIKFPGGKYEDNFVVQPFGSVTRKLQVVLVGSSNGGLSISAGGKYSFK